MVYDVNAAIDKPNVWGAFQQGRVQAQQIKQNQNALAQQEMAAQDRNALRGYAAGILSGDPGAFDQAAAIDPQAAMQYQSAGDQQLKRLKGAIDFIDRAQTPEQKEAAYRQVRPYLNRMSPDGVEPPMTFAEAAPKMEEARARIAMIGNDGPQGAVQSTFIDNQGNRVAIMRDGSTQVLGQNAPNFRAIDTGNGYVGFNPLNNTAAPTMIQGAQQPPPIMPAAPQQFTGADGVPVQIDGDLPPNVQAAIRQAEMQGGAVPNGATLQAAPQVVQASGGMPTGGAMPAQLTSAPKPSEVQRMRIAEEANARAAEAAQRAAEAAALAKRGNAPAGFRFRQDGSLEPIPGGPKPAGAAATEGERKAATLLQRLNGSLQQLQTATTEDPTAAAPTVGASVAGSIPFVGDVARNSVNSAERQRVEAAQLDILDAALTLGTGAAYTKEQLEGYRRSFFPQLGDKPDTIRDKQARLDNVIEAARIAAGRAAPSGGGQPRRVSSAADYEALPSGATFIDPQGNVRRKR